MLPRLRDKLRAVSHHGIEVRREQDGLADFIWRQQPGDEIETSGQNFLKFHRQSGARSGGGEKFRDAFFPGVRMAQRQEGRVHAGQGDEFGQ